MRAAGVPVRSRTNEQGPPRLAVETGGRLDWRDGALLLVIFGATFVYLALLPRNLAQADEAVQLYEAKRLLEGDVMYRDVFEMTTPGYHLTMALLFWIFGTSIDTARLSTAMLHALMGSLVYATCRRFGIRRWFSWPAALACVAVCQPAWPIASQHWLASFFAVGLLFVCSGRDRHSAHWPARPGLLLGLLTSVQQQRGIPMAAGIVLWLVVDHVVQRRYGDRSPSTPLVPQLAWLVVGALAILIPLGVAMIASSGIGPVWEALVIFPIYNYGGITHCPWGSVNIMSLLQSTFTFPSLLKYLPLVFLLTVPRLLYQVLRAQCPEEAARLTLLATFCATSMLSISYFPDFIHIAFIASAFFVSIAESADWGAAKVRAPRWARWTVAASVSVALLLSTGQHLHRNLVRLRAAYPISHPTAFGRIDYANQEEVRLLEQINALLGHASSRDLYVYPILSDLYLTADADNPTPYGFFSALGYNGPKQVQHVLQILADQPPPYVVVLTGLLHVQDPIIAHVQQTYTPLWAPPDAPRVIFQRKDEEASLRIHDVPRGSVCPETRARSCSVRRSASSTRWIASA